MSCCRNFDVWPFVVIVEMNEASGCVPACRRFPYYLQRPFNTVSLSFSLRLCNCLAFTVVVREGTAKGKGNPQR